MPEMTTFLSDQLAPFYNQYVIYMIGSDLKQIEFLFTEESHCGYQIRKEYSFDYCPNNNCINDLTFVCLDDNCNNFLQETETTYQTSLYLKTLDFDLLGNYKITWTVVPTQTWYTYSYTFYTEVNITSDCANVDISSFEFLPLFVYKQQSVSLLFP